MASKHNRNPWLFAINTRAPATGKPPRRPSRICRRWLASVAVSVLLIGCGQRLASEETTPDASAEAFTAVTFAVSHGWHIGVVLPRDDVPVDVWPEVADFADRRYLEVGWGDEAFYRATDVTLALALEAALTPTPSVLHVAGFDRSPANTFPGSGIIELRVTPAGLEALARYVGEAVNRGNAARAPASGPGLYADSRFYPARGTYSLLNNCNHWTARAFAAAGLAVDLDDAATASAVFAQLARLGRVVRPMP